MLNECANYSKLSQLSVLTYMGPFLQHAKMECHQIATEGDLGGKSLSLTSDTAVVADFLSLSPNGESEGPSVTTID